MKQYLIYWCSPGYPGDPSSNPPENYSWFEPEVKRAVHSNAVLCTSWKKEKNTTHIHGIVLTLYNKRGRGQIRSPQGSYSRGFLIFLHWQFSKKPFASNRQVEKNKKRSKSGTTSLELELQLKFVYYQPCNYEIVQTTTTLQKQTLCTLPTYLYMLWEYII